MWSLSAEPFWPTVWFTTAVTTRSRASCGTWSPPLRTDRPRNYRTTWVRYNLSMTKPQGSNHRLESGSSQGILPLKGISPYHCTIGLLLIVVIWVYKPVSITTNCICVPPSGLSTPVPRGRKGKKMKTQSSTFDIQKAEWIRKHNPEHMLQDEGYKKHLKHHCNK